jgi:hypothetical protein
MMQQQEEEEEEEEDEEEEDDVDETLRLQGMTSGLKGVDRIFQKWIRLQVDHWTALTVLSKFSLQSTIQDINISLVNVKHPRVISACEMEDWKDIIKEVAIQKVTGNLDFDPIRAIDHLTEQINAKAHLGGIFAAFAKAVVEFFGNIHCEAALALLTIETEVQSYLSRYFVELTCCTKVRDHCSVKTLLSRLLGLIEIYERAS